MISSLFFKTIIKSSIAKNIKNVKVDIQIVKVDIQILHKLLIS